MRSHRVDTLLAPAPSSRPSASPSGALSAALFRVLVGSTLAFVIALGTACGGRDMTEDGPGAGGSSGAGGGSGGSGGSGGASSFTNSTAPLDEGQVYFRSRVGTLQQAVSSVDAPDTIRFGFDQDTLHVSGFRVDPTDGGLIYIGDPDEGTDDQVLEWVPDDVSTTANETLNDNDSPAVTPCPDTSSVIEVLEAFLFAPSGVFYYLCRENAVFTWHDGGGNLFYDGGLGMMAVADAGFALLSDSSRVLHVFDEAGAMTTEVAPQLTQNNDVAMRGLTDGFWVTVPDAAGDELWMVDTSAVATMVDTYPPYPAGFGVIEAVLDDTGRLVVLGLDTSGSAEEVIMRAPMGGTTWTEILRESAFSGRIATGSPGPLYLFSGP